MLSARLCVGLGHRVSLAERPAALGGDDDHPRARGAFEHALPFLVGEVRLGCHVLVPVSRGSGMVGAVPVRPWGAEAASVRRWGAEAASVRRWGAEAASVRRWG